MYPNLPMNKLPLLVAVVLLLLIPTQAIARVPTAFCAPKPLYKQFPLTIGETLTYDMATAFTGYNLSVKLLPNPKITAQITNKFALLDSRSHNQSQIISHYIESKDNTIGTEFFILAQSKTNTTYLSYGQIKEVDRLPVPTARVVVTSDPQIRCFDAALFLDHGIAIVDCVRVDPTPLTPLANIFIFINLATDEKVLVPNEIYGAFTAISKRKFLKFSQPEAGGFTYLLRSYLADGVNAQSADNTYLQIWSVPVTAPMQAELLRVVDRTVLGLNVLRIMDVQLYLGDIFLLDQGTGVFRMDILRSQRLQILGRYRATGFTKLAVYSDDLQDEVLLSLANKHIIHEIDWHKIGAPVLSRSFSLLENSTVKQLLMNDRYVVVQTTAQALNAANVTTTLNYTWVFRRDARTYATAYHVIAHASPYVEIELDKANDRLYVADQSTLSLYSLNAAVLSVSFNSQQDIGQLQQLIISAESIDSNTTVSCNETFNITLTSPLDYTIYSTGIALNTLYSVNFPGQLDIFLDNYFLGPQMDYKVRHLNEDVPNSWVNKLNDTKVTFTRPINPSQISYFHTDVVEELGAESVIYYYQTIFNKTSVAMCRHPWFSKDLECNVEATYQHTSRIAAFTTATLREDDLFFYYYFLVLSATPNRVTVIDFLAHSVLFNITYPGTFEGEVSSVASSNGYLYVLRKNVKTIDVYDLRGCISSCKLSFSLDPATARGLGIDYFSPQLIVTDRAHPEVLFLKCIGLIAIIDVDNKNKLHLLDLITSELTKQKYYNIVVNSNRMLVVTPPDFMHEYSLDNLYLKGKIKYVKALPSYGYTIQPEADVEFSDQGTLAYINVKDNNKNVSAILIFRLGQPAANSLYSIVTLDRLYSRPGFQIEVSGVFVDFLTIVAGERFTCYRVFQYPFLSIDNAFFNYSFQVEVSNKNATMVSNNINVTVTNFASKIEPTAIFNQSLSLLTAKQTGNYSWEDRKWFTGSGVVNYTYNCSECGGKVKVREHIDSVHELQVSGNSYIQTITGGFSVERDLYRFRQNGSVWEIINLPDQSRNEECVKLTAAEHNQYVITACNHRAVGVKLYITSLASSKGFTWGPYLTDAVNVRRLEAVGGILMLVDVPENPQYFFRTGSVFLYRISFDHTTGQQFNQIQQIDGKDFQGLAEWSQEDIYFGNAHLTYSNLSKTYRLYITQLTGGLFVVDFTCNSDFDLTVLSTTFIDLNKILNSNEMHMPNDAVFLAVTFASVKYNPSFDTENVIVTTKGYHNFQFTIIYDTNGRYISALLHRVYYRYAFYQAYNEIQRSTGFMAVGYTLPAFFVGTDYPRHYVAIYDTLDYPSESEKGYSSRSILGATAMNTSLPATFAFNTTYDHQTMGQRIGLVIGLPSINKLLSASVAHNLSLSLESGYASQTISLTAVNDVSHFLFTVDILSDNGGDELLLYIIFALCGLVIVAFAIYVFRVNKRNHLRNQRESLITTTEASVLQPSRQNINAYVPPTQTNQQRQPSKQIRQEVEQSSSQEQSFASDEVDQLQQETEQYNNGVNVASAEQLPLPKKQNILSPPIEFKQQDKPQTPKKQQQRQMINSAQELPLPRKQIQNLSSFPQSKKQQSKKQQSKKEQGRKQQSKKQQSKKEQGKKQQGKKQQSKKEQSKKEQSKKEQSKKQQSKKEQSKKEQSKKQQSKKFKGIQQISSPKLIENDYEDSSPSPDELVPQMQEIQPNLSPVDKQSALEQGKEDPIAMRGLSAENKQ